MSAQSPNTKLTVTSVFSLSAHKSCVTSDNHNLSAIRYVVSFVENVKHGLVILFLFACQMMVLVLWGFFVE